MGYRSFILTDEDGHRSPPSPERTTREPQANACRSCGCHCTGARTHERPRSCRRATRAHRRPSSRPPEHDPQDRPVATTPVRNVHALWRLFRLRRLLQRPPPAHGLPRANQGMGEHPHGRVQGHGEGPGLPLRCLGDLPDSPRCRHEVPDDHVEAPRRLRHVGHQDDRLQHRQGLRLRQRSHEGAVHRGQQARRQAGLLLLHHRLDEANPRTLREPKPH